MAVDLTTFRLRFPEFADDTEYPDARIQLFLDDAVCFLGADENRWKGKYNLAQSYLAAHLLTVGTKSEVGDTSANVGAVTSKSAGGVSVSKGYTPKNSSHSDDYLMSTVYGQQFINIRDMCFVGVLVANCI